ncbi:hypothetical protein EYF80_057207 [Liparis tanakae]|uniref:Uncharacterized protein n=1 Tax=Liparis tanakae TaxID=230148 RepID=A0A4Z2EWK9_9TELE|nr:hypothetical protein EYF80_057207 [Liparis tanakae]
MLVTDGEAQVERRRGDRQGGRLKGTRASRQSNNNTASSRGHAPQRLPQRPSESPVRVEQEAGGREVECGAGHLAVVPAVGPMSPERRRSCSAAALFNGGGDPGASRS